MAITRFHPITALVAIGLDLVSNKDFSWGDARL